MHWAHTEVALELSVTSLGGDQVAVEVTVSSWGNYWDNRQEPRTARCRLTGTLSEAAHECVITVTAPAPVAELRFDPRKPVTSLLSGLGDTPAMPAFCEPLIVDASRP